MGREQTFAFTLTLAPTLNLTSRYLHTQLVHTPVENNQQQSCDPVSECVCVCKFERECVHEQASVLV